MTKSSYEKAVEKQIKAERKSKDRELREQRKQAEQKECFQTASLIVNGRPVMGGMRIMDQASEEVLKSILSKYKDNENKELHVNNDMIPTRYWNSIRREFEKLKLYGVISNYTMYCEDAWYVVFSPTAFSYFENKEKAMTKDNEDKAAQIQIGSIVANGSNFIFGNAINSTLTVDNSIQRIEQEINEKGGEDSEELRQILDDVKEYIENMQESNHIVENKGLFSKIYNHIQKHSWFYGEIVNLLGTAVLQIVQKIGK